MELLVASTYLLQLLTVLQFVLIVLSVCFLCCSWTALREEGAHGISNTFF